jgi:GH24 family phage-related lysozyme (muramidase)
MRDSVRNNFIAFSAPFEGRIDYMYLDVKGLVTTGVGNLIDSVAAAQALPWQVGKDGPAATADQVKAEWEMVKSRQDLKNTLADKAFKPITSLRLSEASIDALILAKLDANEPVLKRTPEFSTFDSWPADAQLGLQSMAWGMGAGFAMEGRWPNFRAAVAAGNWTSAAANCDMSTTGNPGVIPRNAANRQLFTNAQRVINEGLDPDVLLYPVGSVPGHGGGTTTPQATGRAIFSLGGNVIAFDVAANAAANVVPLVDYWKGLDGTGFDQGVRAVVSMNNKTYAFLGDSYVRLQNRVADGGYPLSIGQYWPGFADAGFDSGIEAAANWGNGKVYFFKGDQYLRYDIAGNVTDPGYPRPIAGNWPGVAEAGFDGIDAVVVWPSGKVYMFRGDSYLRYDRGADKVDDGYPRTIAGNWAGLAEAGMGGPFDAVWME